MNLVNKENIGIIYVWIFQNEVVYVGRTIKSLHERIDGHKREYSKQLEKGLITKKFVRVKNLEFEWDSLIFKVIEEVRFDEINNLGERELFWFNHFSKIGDLWNSAIPSKTDYLSLSIEERAKRRELKQFQEFFVKKLDDVIYQMIGRYYQSSLELIIRPMNKNTFYFYQDDINKDFQSILINTIEDYKEKKYFKALLGRLIELLESSKPLYYSPLSIDNIYYELYESKETILNIYELSQSVDLESIFQFAINEWDFRYKDKKTKELDYEKKFSVLNDFEANFSEKYNSFNIREDLDDEILLYQQEILLLEETEKFNKEHPEFFRDLELFMYSSSIRGFDNQSIRTDYFKDHYGINYLEDFFYRLHRSDDDKLIPLGYDLRYISEMLGFAGVFHIILLDFNKLSNERVVFDYDRTIPALFEDDKPIVLSCVEINGLAVKYASDRLKDDLEIAMAAVKNNGLSLEFLSNRIKNNADIVFAAVQSDGKAIHSSNPKFMKDISIVMESSRTHPNVAKYIDSTLLNDENLAIEVVSRSGRLLNLFPISIRSNRSIVEAAVIDDGNSLEFASIELRDDIDLVKIAVKRDPESIKFASEELQKNKAILDSQRKNIYRPSTKEFITFSELKSKKT
jgi:hypothetical protein